MTRRSHRARAKARARARGEAKARYHPPSSILHPPSSLWFVSIRCGGKQSVANSSPIRIGILTVSDRASRGEYEDLGGPAIRACLTEILSCTWEPVARVIPDA